MNYIEVINKLNPDEWAIPELFIENNKEFLQAFLDKAIEAINYTHCCTELCDCVLPYIKRAEVCGGCGLLIKK